MGAFFRDARLKIKRADKHIGDLKTAIILLEKTYTSTIKIDEHTGQESVIHTVPGLEDELLELSLISGDAIHNLHTALDFAWNRTIELRAPDIKSRHSKFPVRDSREELENALHGAKVDSCFRALYDVIVSNIQPYENGQNGVIWPLHELDISDKHLLLLDLIPNVGIKGLVIRDKDGQIFHGSGVPVQNSGPYVITFTDDIHIENKGELSFAVTMKEAGIFKGLPILDLLSGFSQYVLYVVELLEFLENS